MKKVKRRDFIKVAAASPLLVSPLRDFSIHSNAETSLFTPSDNSANPWLEINLENMAWNIRQIKSHVKNRPVMAVIKANAYGHGLLETARFLEEQDIDMLAVGKTSEALILRMGGIRKPILNFGPFTQDEAKEIVKNQIAQSVYTSDVKWLAEAAKSSGKVAGVHIKIDTGLGRVGVEYYRALPIIEKIARSNSIDIKGIFTPLTEDVEFDKEQLARFTEICESAMSKGIDIGLKHVASSAAVLSYPESHLDMVRPGIAIYGQYPSTEEFEKQRVALKPAMAMKSRIIYLKTLRPGDSVSYHRSYTAKNEIRLATVPTGYSDGYPYRFGNKGEVLIGGARCPMIGLVTSNHFTVDVSKLKNVSQGDEVVLFGKQGDEEITVEEVAAWADTSVYKILIWMNPLLPRIYVN
jgi:alanine racemase